MLIDAHANRYTPVSYITAATLSGEALNFSKIRSTKNLV